LAQREGVPLLHDDDDVALPSRPHDAGGIAVMQINVAPSIDISGVVRGMYQLVRKYFSLRALSTSGFIKM
jgi:hypothetical protein